MSINIVNIEVKTKDIKDFRNEVKLQLADIFDDVADNLVDSTRHRFFDSKTSPTGDSWDDTLRSLRVGRQSILIKTGALADSIQHDFDFYSVKVGREIDISFNIFSTVSYSGIHQDGGIDEDGNFIERRQFLGISENDKSDIEKMLGKVSIKW